MASLLKELRPLANATFEASQSINRTAPILAWTQVLMIVLLTAIFFALFGLLVTLNPDLSSERQQFVTPAVRSILSHLVTYSGALSKLLTSLRWLTNSIIALLTGRFHTSQGTPTPSSDIKAVSQSGDRKPA